jgi:hypothetical protein
MFVVFNCAHKDASIKANGAHIRILAVASQDKAFEMSRGRNEETRVWPMSGGAQDIRWRLISNANLSKVSDSDVHATLQEEYKRAEKQVVDWNQWRDSKCIEVIQAAKEHVMRPLEQVRASALLNIQTADTEVHENAPQQTALDVASEAASEVQVVKPIETSQERRGQSFALVAILRDPYAAKQKETLLATLGSTYYKLVEHFKASNTEFREEELLSMDEFPLELKNAIHATRIQLDAIVEEPLVAFLDVSDRAEPLIEKSSMLAKDAALKHADLAVCRMYEWCSLDHTHKAEQRVVRTNGGSQGLALLDALRQSERETKLEINE